jgi:O-antigen/teichoic acid export membrane protein
MTEPRVLPVLLRGFLDRAVARSKAATVGHTLWLGSSSVLTGVIGAVIAGILTRFLGVADYGVYALVVSLVALLTDVADLGVSSSVVRFGSQSIAEGDSRKLATVIGIVTRWKLIIGAVVLGGALVVLGAFWGLLFQHVDDRLGSYLRLALVACALGILAGVYAPIYQSFQRFRAYALVLIARAVAKLALVVAVVYGIGRASVGVMIWIEIASLLLFLALMVAWSPVKAVSLRPRDAGLERQMVAFTKWISLYQVIALLAGRLDLAFVGALADAQALGLYGAASKVSGLGYAVAGSYMAVLLTDLSSAVTGDGLRRKRRSAFAVVGVMTGAILLTALFADPLVRLLFGEAFEPAAPVLRVLCVGLCFTVLAFPINATLFALNRSAVFPILSAASLLAFAAASWYLVPRHGALGAAAASALSAMVSFGIGVGFYLRASRSGPPAQPPGSAEGAVPG